MASLRVIWLGLSLVALACSSQGDDGAPDTGGADSGSDTGNDAPDSSGTDSGGPDAGSDAGNDGGDAGGDGSDDGNGNGGAWTRGDCKRGLAYGGHSKADFAQLSPAISWWYNWHFLPDTALRDGSYRDADVEYVPMFHSNKVPYIPDDMIAQIPSDSRMLLGFNEPNFKVGQANLSAADAAALWPEVERIADAHDLLIASPAVNYCWPEADCWNTNPYDYLDDFYAACQGCRVDRIAFHIYVGCNAGGENHAQWLIDHVNNYKTRFPEPEYPKFWLTEFACNDAANFEQQQAFLEDALEFLENEPRIERYAWFQGRADNMNYVDLYGADGQLTTLGQAYRDAAQPAACTH